MKKVIVFYLSCCISFVTLGLATNFNKIGDQGFRYGFCVFLLFGVLIYVPLCTIIAWILNYSKINQAILSNILIGILYCLFPCLVLALADALAKSQGGTSGNAINGISANNPKKEQYEQARKKKNLENSTKRQRIIVGSIVEIPIDREYYVYAQILSHRGYALFDCRYEKPLRDLSELLNKPVLFVVCVYDYIIKNNIWSVVGKLPIRKDLQKQPLMYIYDVHTDKYCLYDNNTGEITPCTKDKARGLERASVWEDRIRDYYNNLPCIWLSDHYQLFPETNPCQESEG